MSLREEFHLHKVGFSDVRPERFYMFQWRSPGLLYVAYRVILAAYTMTWLGIAIHEHASSEYIAKHGLQAYGAYLTNWTYILLTLYFTLHALVAVIQYCCGNHRPRLAQNLEPVEHRHIFEELLITTGEHERIRADDEMENMEIRHRSFLPWYLVIVWVLFNAASTASLMVTLVFWAILVPYTNFNILNVENFQLHLVNTILVLLEHSLTAVPLRVLHMVYPVVYGITYAVFSIFYWVDDHSHVMYKILDWNDPWPTFGYVLFVGLVIIPCLHLFLYAIYRLRLRIFRCINRESL